MEGHVRARGKRKDGSTVWQARYRDPRDPTSRTRIEKTFHTRRDAERWLTQQQAQIINGEHNDPRRADRPFQTAVDAWRETRAASLAPKTRDRYEAVLNIYLLPEFGPTPTAHLTREVIKRYFARLAHTTSKGSRNAGQPLGPGTVRKVHTVLSSVLSEAVELGIIRTNPALRLRLPQAPQRKHTVLTATEVNTLAQAIDPHYRALIYVAAYTGLRAGELWALRRADVDLLRGVLHVRHTVKRDTADPATPRHARDRYGREVGPPKNGRPRSISLPRHLRQMLDQHLTAPTIPGGGTGPEALVFLTPSGKPVRHTLFVARVFKPAVAAAVPHKAHLRFHDLRHTCATLLISAGAHAKHVQERLGHASITTTLDLYGHVLPSTEAALVAQMDALYESTGTEA